MTNNFITFTQTFDTSDAASTTLPNSYINMKREIMDLIKTQMSATGLGFTFLSEDAPLATAAAQTINIAYNTPLVCNETGNWLFRIQLIFGALNSPGNLTIRFDFMRNLTSAASLILHSIAGTDSVIAAWGTNPASVSVDVNRVLARSDSSVSVGLLRSNFTPVIAANTFAVSAYSLYKYKVLQTGETRWGGVSNSVGNQPLQTILAPSASVITTLGFSAQTQFGFIPSATAEWHCLEMPSVFWNETNTITSPVLYSFDVGADMELLFVTAPATGINPAITQGAILNPTGTLDDYYVVSVFMGKMALVKITV